MEHIFTENRLIVLNSKNGTQLNGGFNSQLSFPFKYIFSRDGEKDIINIGCSLLNAEIPVSFYNINVYNQVLKYTISSTQYTLTIPEGNYSSTTFITTFQSLYAAGGHGATITLTYSTITGKLTFQATVSNVIFNYTNSTMFEVLGLNQYTNYTFTTSSAVTAPYMLNLLGQRILKIQSPSLTFDNHDSVSSLNNHLIQTLPIDKPAYGLITYQSSNNGFHLIKETYLNSFVLEIRDSNDNLVDFNNIHYSLTLLLQIQKKIRTELFKEIDYENLKINDVEPEKKKPIDLEKRLKDLEKEKSLVELKLLEGEQN